MIDICLNSHSVGSYTSANFDRETNRVRQIVGDTHDTYFDHLYGEVPPKKARQHLRRELSNAYVILLGGGRSHFTADLIETGANNFNVLNIDPYMEEEVDNDLDRILPISSADVHIPEVIQAELETTGLNKLRAFALFSVPYYLRSGSEITATFQNILALSRLTSDFEFRLSPLSLYLDRHNREYFDPNSERINAFNNGIEMLCHNGISVEAHIGEFSSWLIASKYDFTGNY